MSLLFSAVVTFFAVRLILKRYDARVVLMLAGIVLLAYTNMIGLDFMEGKKFAKWETGSEWLDIAGYIMYLTSYRAGGLGLVIMVLVAFSAVMSYIGANTKLVELVTKPLTKIGSPYFLLLIAFLVGSSLSLAVSSATGLGVLLMSTLYPTLIRIGVSPGAAVAAFATTSAISFSPTASDSMIAAQNIGMDYVEYIFSWQLPIAIPSIVAIGIGHYFWQKHMDKKGLVMRGEGEAEIKEFEKADVPSWFALLPFVPVVLILIVNSISSIKMSVTTTVAISIVIGIFAHALHVKDFKKTCGAFDECWKKMSEVFASVIMLLVAGGTFAHGLKASGAIEQLINIASSLGFGAFAMMMLFVVLTVLAAIVMGSGNAPFYAFVELIPKVAESAGINPLYIILPMQQASNAARTFSPISAVMVATSGMAKISPFDIIKRTIPPVMFGLLVNIVLSVILISPTP